MVAEAIYQPALNVFPSIPIFKLVFDINESRVKQSLLRNHQATVSMMAILSDIMVTIELTILEPAHEISNNVAF